MAVMFPFGEAELARRARAETAQPKPRREWVRRGFFKDFKRMSRREVAMRANNARMWLEYTLHAGPKPAKEILRLAKLEGVTESGLRRAKRHYKVKSIKRGGRRHGWGARWYWLFPASD